MAVLAFIRTFNRETQIFVLMLMLVPLAGQLYFHPFNDSFRVSFGTPTFFFSLLLLRRIHPVVSGLSAGTMVVLFRILLDVSFYSYGFTDAFETRYPTFFYYITFACLFGLFRINRLHHRPLLIGFLGIITEVFSSIAEISFQYISFGAAFTLADLHKISVIAIFRSYFTVGFFNLMKLYTTKIKVQQTREQNAHLLMVISNLYEETIHLDKTLKNSEKITRDAYFLYESLKKLEGQGQPVPDDLPAKTLKIVGEIHDIKKDNQRIFSGLSKLISDENFAEYMDVKALLNLVAKVNQEYAVMLKKEIKINVDAEGSHPKYHVYSMLSIINNLVTNAIEAIENKGIVTLHAEKKGDWVHLHISDNGPGISEKRQQVIFEPGFTSKYATSGVPSTGIGLSYVTRVVEEFHGKIRMKSIPEVKGTVFTIQLPIKSLVKKG